MYLLNPPPNHITSPNPIPNPNPDPNANPDTTSANPLLPEPFAAGGCTPKPRVLEEARYGTDSAVYTRSTCHL